MGIPVGSIISLRSIGVSQLAIHLNQSGVIITTGRLYIMCRPSVAISSVYCMTAKEIQSVLPMADLLVEETEDAPISSLNAQTSNLSGKIQGRHDHL